MMHPGVLERLPDTARTEAKEELDARIAAAFAEGARSVDVSRLLPEVEAAATAADAAAEEARTRALDPLDEVKLARRDWEDAAFTLDRLREAGRKLAERIEALKALERDRAQRAEHERLSAERTRLAEEMERMAEPIVQIAHLVSKIDACDRQIGRLNATSAVGLGYMPMVLAGTAPAIRALFQDAVVWDAFIALAGLPSKAA
jgi:hypothetical protein